LIYEAAQRCVPPLFDDQPQEKVNINAKLGFGMHLELKMEHEGETTWYTPMSCEKIKLHLPHLCQPDELCKKIGNPLSYYNRMLWEVRTLKHADSDDGSTGIWGNFNKTGASVGAGADSAGVDSNSTNDIPNKDKDGSDESGET
jgi:DNA primase large subunit